jgi:hypothetical protein
MNRNEIIQYFSNLNYSGFKNFYDKYKDFFKNGFTDDFSERIESSIVYPEAKDSLIIFEIRCNEDISFNNEIRNNDLLLVLEIQYADEKAIEYLLHQFDCTTDPCSQKYHIAHTARQIYRGNVGLHHGTPGRTCIRSDEGGGTWVRRTDAAGNVIPLNPKHADAELGHFGINIHDNGGFANSSLGCTILAGGSYLEPGPYRDEYKPLLLKCTNKNNIPVALIDMEDVEDIINHELPGDNTPPEQPKNDNSGEAKGAIRDEVKS